MKPKDRERLFEDIRSNTKQYTPADQHKITLLRVISKVAIALLIIVYGGFALIGMLSVADPSIREELFNVLKSFL